MQAVPPSLVHFPTHFSLPLQLTRAIYSFRITREEPKGWGQFQVEAVEKPSLLPGGLRNRMCFPDDGAVR